MEMAVVVEAGGEIDVLDDDLAIVVNARLIVGFVALVCIAGDGAAPALDEVESLAR